VSGPWVPDWKPDKGKKPKAPPKPCDWSKRQDGQKPASHESAAEHIERIRARLRGQKSAPEVPPPSAEEKGEMIGDVPVNEIPF